MWVAFQITAATSALARPSVVFTDCDGTMLNPAHSLSARSRSVLRELDHIGVWVVPATGRARAGSWTEDVLTEPALRGGSLTELFALATTPTLLSPRRLCHTRRLLVALHVLDLVVIPLVMLLYMHFISSWVDGYCVF